MGVQDFGLVGFQSLECHRGPAPCREKPCSSKTVAMLGWPVSSVGGSMVLMAPRLNAQLL